MNRPDYKTLRALNTTIIEANLSKEQILTLIDNLIEVCKLQDEECAAAKELIKELGGEQL